MADSKISALPASTVPLAGTEVLPIVQSSTTKQVSVANLTAGRSVSVADLAVSTGNIVPGTAAKGINYTANTPKAGMTSQLLNWYEEGTWTPNQGAGLTVVGGLTATGTYTRVGRVVTITAKYVAGTSMTIGAANVLSDNIPFSSAAAFSYTGAITANGVTDNGVVILGGTTVYTALAFTSKTQLFFTITYNV